MNALLARAGAFFVAPAAPAVRVVPVAHDLVGVLARPEDLDAVAGGVAAGLRRRHHARTALVCRPGAAAVTPATPAARALARRLAARELPAAPAGTVCRVGLPAPGAEAAPVAWRAATAAAGVPTVIALSVRDADWDALLAQLDQLLLAAPLGADPAYVDLAMRSLAALGVPAARITPPPGPLTRRAAALGFAGIPVAPLAVVA